MCDFDTIDMLKPTIIGGYNSSNFDWNWLFKRAEILQMDTTRFKTLNPNEGYKINDGVLKLGAEIEDYKQIKIWGYNSLDIAHAVRRAQTINSEIKSWGLKYITQFSKSARNEHSECVFDFWKWSKNCVKIDYLFNFC